MEICNRLLERLSFLLLMVERGVMARNQLIDMVMASLSDLMKNRSEQQVGAGQAVFWISKG